MFSRDVAYIAVIVVLVGLLIAAWATEKKCPAPEHCPLVSKGGYYSINPMYTAIYLGTPSSNFTPTATDSRLYLGDGIYMLGSSHKMQVQDNRLLLHSLQSGLLAVAQSGSLFLGSPTDAVLSAASKRPGMYISGSVPQVQDPRSPWYAMREFLFSYTASKTMALRDVYFKDDTSIRGYQIDTGLNEIVVTSETIFFGKNIYPDTILRSRGAAVVVNGTVVSQTAATSLRTEPLECVELPITGTTNILRITKYSSPSNCASARLRDRSSRTMIAGGGICVSSENLPELVQSAPGAVSFVLGSCPTIGSGITQLSYTWYDTDECLAGTGYSATVTLGACLQGNIMFTCESAT